MADLEGSSGGASWEP